MVVWPGEAVRGDGDGGTTEPARSRETMLHDDDIAAISHDLKNPLSMIALDVSILQERVAPHASFELRRALTRIEQNVTFINRLVHDLLDLSAIDAAKLTLLMEPLELAGLVTEVIERATPARDRARVTVEATAPVVVIGDGPRLERVVANLVTNALKYGLPSSDVVVQLEGLGAWARVSVTDRGPGLAPDEATAVFDKFRRARTAHGHEGTGLGLFVSRKIIEAHGGRIGVESAGSGSQFYFELPRQVPAPPQP